MSELRLHVMTLFIIVMAIIQNTGTSQHSNRGSIKNLMWQSENEFGNFFGAYIPDSKKPDFITAYDLVKLMDLDYAFEQFYCVVKEKPCDDVGKRIIATITEDLKSDCQRCTMTEKENIERIIEYVSTNFPEWWDRILPLYKKSK